MGSLYVNIMSQTFNYFNGLTWDNVVWNDSYEKVRRIQKRIFKASKSSDKKRMWFLQKLLITNPHAKLVAVHMVTNNSGSISGSSLPNLRTNQLTETEESNFMKSSKNFQIEPNTLKEFSSEEKLLIARNLKINGKVHMKKLSPGFTSLSQSNSSKSGKKRKNIPVVLKNNRSVESNYSNSLIPRRGLSPEPDLYLQRKYWNICSIQDRAKQVLCLLALEPEWKAKLEHNLRKFRSSKSVQEAIERLSFHLNSFAAFPDGAQDKFVFTVGIGKYFSKMTYEAFLLKLDTFPLMEKQIGAWLQGGLLDQYLKTFKPQIPFLTGKPMNQKVDFSEQYLFQISEVISPIFFPLWLEENSKEQNVTPEELISHLLLNILLYSLENHLLTYVSNLPNCHVVFSESKYQIKPWTCDQIEHNSSGPRFQVAKGLEEQKNNLQQKVSNRYVQSPNNQEEKTATLTIVRYADNFVFVHKNLDVLKLIAQEIESWISKTGLTGFHYESNLKLVSQGFEFLGFQITCIRVQGKVHVKIIPSKQSVLYIIHKTRTIIQSNKAASAYELICKLKPVLLGWANYYKFCECKPTFSKIDNLVYQQLRAWVFRRAVRQGRQIVKQKYFPSGKQYTFQGHTYTGNWILNGTKRFNNNQIKTIFLPKISWIRSNKLISSSF